MASMGVDLREAYLHRRIKIERDFLLEMFESGHVAKSLTGPQ